RGMIGRGSFINIEVMLELIIEYAMEEYEMDQVDQCITTYKIDDQHLLYKIYFNYL
ncbi:22071_t:CDS:1, partial [Gigaspora margarita]